MIGRFLHWWGRELAALVPAWLRRALGGRATLVVEAVEALPLTLNERGRAHALGPLDALSARTLRRLARAARRGRLDITLVVAEGRAVRQTLSLPAAAARDLSSVVHFQIGRVTPFQPDEVHHAHTAPRPVADTDRVDTDLIYTPRAPLEPLMARLRQARLPVGSIDLHTDGAPAGLNLLRPQTGWRWTPGRRLAAVLSILLVVLGGAWAWLTDAQQAERIDALTAQLAMDRRTAIAAQQQEEDAADSAAARAYLRRRDTPMAAEILAAAARLTPDDTWVERMAYDGKTLELSGTSANATRLIALFEGDPLFRGAAFRTPVTRAAEGERFVLSVVIATPEQPE